MREAPLVSLVILERSNLKRWRGSTSARLTPFDLGDEFGLETLQVSCCLLRVAVLGFKISADIGILPVAKPTIPVYRDVVMKDPDPSLGTRKRWLQALVSHHSAFTRNQEQGFAATVRE
ncbi:hypothetical protein X757_31690 [Mesorhizobium sp. LSHC414A00]|nr:hypothetical protein X757_31690 [Mesorhizobium sp. LSHC414A00]